jgi:hypothetical protein
MGTKPQGDDRHPGFMVESATILARHGDHAVLNGSEGEADISGPALTCSTKANFQPTKSDLGFVPLREWRAPAPAAANATSIQKLHQTNDPVTLLLTSAIRIASHVQM